MLAYRAGLLDFLADALGDELANKLLQLASTLTLDHLNHLLANVTDLHC